MAALSLCLVIQAENGFLAQLWCSMARNPILLLPIIAFAIAYAVLRPSQGRTGPVVPESSVPNGISPAESGMLLHDCIGSREVAATLVDLSVKKLLSIADTTPEMGGPPDEHNLVFRLLRPEAEWPPLASHEKTLLRQAFRNNDWAAFSQLRTFVPEIVPAMQEQIKNSLWEKGLIRNDPNNPSTPRWKIIVYVASLMGLLDGLVAAQSGLGLHLYEYPGLALLMIAITMGIIVWAVQNPASLNEKGTQARAYLEGLREFIATVDADRLQRLRRYRFDELLPYAIVLGVEQKWAATFRQLAVQPFGLVGSEEADSLLGGSSLTTLSAYLQPAGSKLSR